MLPANLVGAAIRHARQGFGWSARDLSLKAGLSESYVGKLEGGRLDPSLRAFGKIAQALGLNCAEVYVLVMQAARSEAVTPSE